MIRTTEDPVTRMAKLLALLHYLYCPIDHVLYNGFNADLERPSCRALGDACCDFYPKPGK
jgi:hypothetical protein